MGEYQQRLRVRINGRVQGVGFRHFVMTRARELELNGWVRNARDGAVVVEAEGRREDLETLLRKLHSGPRSAEVASVDANWAEADGSMDRFSVRF